jgi:hypothetical protein
LFLVDGTSLCFLSKLSLRAAQTILTHCPWTMDVSITTWS